MHTAVLGVNGKYHSSISIHWSPWPNLYRKIESRVCWPMHYLINNTYDCRKSFVKNRFCGYRQRTTGNQGATGGPEERAAGGRSIGDFGHGLPHHAREAGRVFKLSAFGDHRQIEKHLAVVFQSGVASVLFKRGLDSGHQGVVHIEL
jgi:hypothetical protein